MNQNEIRLKLTYQKLTFAMNEPIKLNINDCKDIFYYKNIDFPIYEKKFFSFGQRQPPILLKFTKKELFGYFINYFVSKGRNKLDIFLDKSLYEFVLIDGNISKEGFDFIDNYFNSYSIYSHQIYFYLIKIILNKIINENEYKYEYLQFFLLNFNKRNLPQLQEIFLETIFKNNISFISINIDRILFFLNFVQFHNEWFIKIFEQTEWKNFGNSNTLNCLPYQELIFRLIKYPSFILDKNDIEEKLRKIFSFLSLFKLEEITSEYRVLISSNQMGFYRILCKEINISEKKFPSQIFIEINVFKELNKWINESLKNDIKTTLIIIVRNKEYIYNIAYREQK